MKKVDDKFTQQTKEMQSSEDDWKLLFWIIVLILWIILLSNGTLEKYSDWVASKIFTECAIKNDFSATCKHWLKFLEPDSQS
ncbi:MAG: hypothetical protein VX730_01425 [Pseudomonadota bacterium]|nr:hypothetical protein [Pseudomonadota bacterium]